MTRIKNRPQHDQLPRIGSIRIGEKDVRGYPLSLDHFIATGNYASHFYRVYDAEDPPRVLPIVFPSSDASQVCPQRYEYRDKSGRLFAYGDGETFWTWSKESSKYVETPSNDKIRASMERGEWKEILTLRFVITSIRGIYGVWQLTTSAAASSIPRVVGVFDRFRDRWGDLITRVPFDLTVEKVQSQKPGETRVFPALALVPNVTEDRLELLQDRMEDLGAVRGLLTDENVEKLIASPDEMPADDTVQEETA